MKFEALTTTTLVLWRKLRRWEERTDFTPFGVLAMRLSLAAYWGVHWAYKALYEGMGTTEHLFASLGFPPWLAWGDVAFELFAFVALAAGFYVRTVSLLLLVILVPALRVWTPKGLWAIHGGYEFPLLWILMQLSLCLLGSGAYAVGAIGSGFGVETRLPRHDRVPAR